MAFADGYVTHVRYDSERNRIVKVKFCYSEDGPKYEKARMDIVKLIEDGKVIKTLTNTRRQEIHVLNIDGEKFLRTDKNKTKKDNLEELPEF
ncbi:MAG TPA: DUF3892 domain-containing protein [Limnochordia bacterium]|jgi:uncharacterized protein YjhX (UPF0386 family)|nr:DUF3892 domain-containing protein [Limnochordia bacterium]